MNSMSQPFRSAHAPCVWPKAQHPKTTHAPFASSNKESCHANTSRHDPAVLFILRPGLARSNVEGSLEGLYEAAVDARRRKRVTSSPLQSTSLPSKELFRKGTLF